VITDNVFIYKYTVICNLTEQLVFKVIVTYGE